MNASSDSARRTRLWISVVAGIMLVVLVGVGLFTYRAAAATADADDKANQLITALGDAGLRAPAKEQIVRVLGDDGGAVCVDPSSALVRTGYFAQLGNGAAGPGQRPVIVANRLVQGEQIILQIYCPDQLDEFTGFTEDLKYADVLKG
jgi:hypothetical protein